MCEPPPFPAPELWVPQGLPAEPAPGCPCACSPLLLGQKPPVHHSTILFISRFISEVETPTALLSAAVCQGENLTSAPLV